jgi:protein-tyrosine phosphatase
MPAPVKQLDADRVAPGLYVGSAPPAGVYPPFKMIVLCAQEYQPPADTYPGSIVVHAPNDDNPLRGMYVNEITIATMAATRVAHALLNHERVLVTCWMGRNRSALVAGLAMRTVYGLSGEQAVRAIRAARGPLALSNPSFRRLLKRNG